MSPSESSRCLEPDRAGQTEPSRAEPSRAKPSKADPNHVSIVSLLKTCYVEPSEPGFSIDRSIQAVADVPLSLAPHRKLSRRSDILTFSYLKLEK